MTCFKKKTFTIKKGYCPFLQNLQSIISLHALKLAFIKSMRASDDEQGTNKLRPKRKLSQPKIYIFKDTHREKEPSNRSPVLTQSMNMGIRVVGKSNQLIRDSKTETKYF